MFTIKITAVPSTKFEADEPEALAEPLTFAGFRTRTGRRAAITYGTGTRATEVTFAVGARRPATWATAAAAERNVDRLSSRGYVAQVEEV